MFSVDRIDRRNCRRYVHTHVIAMENSLAVTPKRIFAISLTRVVCLFNTQAYCWPYLCHAVIIWSLCSRTALYSCRGQNRWQSTHELMSSQAREKSALTNDIQICVIHLATIFTSVAVLLWLLCYFGCKFYLHAVMKWSVCSYYVICSWNM